MKEKKVTKEQRLNLRITKELYDELNERAEACNTTISKVAEARLHNNDSILDKRAVYKAMMKVSVLLEKQESQYKKIDNTEIRKELQKVCIMLNS